MGKKGNNVYERWKTKECERSANGQKNIGQWGKKRKTKKEINKEKHWTKMEKKYTCG